MSVEIRHADDWVAIYKDGRKVEEGHSTTPERLLEVLGIEHASVWFEETNEWGEPVTPDGAEPFPEVLP